MTYYAIQSRDKLDYWDQAINGWCKVPYLYPPDKAVTLHAVLRLDTPGMKDAVVVEVTCDIKPVKAWVKKPIEWAYDIKHPVGNVSILGYLHKRLTDGTLRVCDAGWEVYE